MDIPFEDYIREEIPKYAKDEKIRFIQSCERYFLNTKGFIATYNLLKEYLRDMTIEPETKGDGYYVTVRGYKK